MSFTAGEPGHTETPEPLPAEGGPELRRVRARLALLIVAAQALSIWWIADSEIARDVYLICYSLMMPTVLYLFLTRLARRWLPLTDRELLLGYIVLTATLPVLGFGAMRFLIEGQGYLSWFSIPQPDWLKYLPYLKSLPLLRDPAAVRDFYLGGRTGSVAGLGRADRLLEACTCALSAHSGSRSRASCAVSGSITSGSVFPSPWCRCRSYDRR